MVFTGVSMLVGIFNTGLSSGFGELIQTQKKSLLKAYSEYEFFYYMFVTVIFSCTIILGLSFIKIYTNGITDIPYINPVILILFSVTGILEAWKIPQATIIIAAGHYRQTRHRAIIEASITIVACTVLTCFFGIYGTLCGRICGLSYRAIDLLYVSKITDYSFRSTFKRLARMLLLGCLIVLPFTLIVRLAPNSLINWTITAIVVFIWAIFVTIIGNLIPEKNTMRNLCVRGRRILFNLT
jgi:hypothetical protein